MAVKKRVNSKQKGASFERAICSRLSLWVTDMKRDDVFWRSAMSGGRATLAKAASGNRFHAQSGDICAVDPSGASFISKFTVECKSLKDVSATRLLFNSGEAELVKCWDQAVKETNPGMIPLLIIKQNRYPELLCTSPEGTDTLRKGERPGVTLIPHLVVNSTWPIMHVHNFRLIITNCEFSKVVAKA